MPSTHSDDHRAGRRRPVRALAAAALAGALVLGGCTGGVDADSTPAAPTPSPTEPRVTEAQPTLEAKPVPFEVSVARVTGERLATGQRGMLVRRIGRVVRSYVEEAFLAGEYPRAGFYPALRSFTDGARTQAWQDRDLLTNAAVGQDVRRVVPRRTEARLFVLRPNSTIAGVTARVRVVFTEERLQGRPRRVVVTGRLLLTRNRKDAWEIFGYDIRRDSPGGKR